MGQNLGQGSCAYTLFSAAVTATAWLTLIVVVLMFGAMARGASPALLLLGAVDVLLACGVVDEKHAFAVPWWRLESSALGIARPMAWVPRYGGVRRATDRRPHTPPEALAAFVATFTEAAYGTLIVALQGGALSERGVSPKVVS
jgi:hypothetical protein